MHEKVGSKRARDSTVAVKAFCVNPFDFDQHQKPLASNREIRLVSEVSRALHPLAMQCVLNLTQIKSDTCISGSIRVPVLCVRVSVAVIFAYAPRA